MVSGQPCPGEVVKAPGARLAAIALPMRLGVVAPVADHRIAAAAGTAHALGPAMLAHQCEALGVVQQGREIDQIDGWHDGGGSSHEPVSYSRSRLHARPPLDSRLSPDPTTLKDDKSLFQIVPHLIQLDHHRPAFWLGLLGVSLGELLEPSLDGGD